MALDTTPIPTFPLRGKENTGEAQHGMPIPTFPLRGKEIFALARGKYFPSPSGGGAPKRGAGAPVSGDATVEAHVSTRSIAALHPAAGSHPSAKADGTCSALRGRRVGVGVGCGL